MGLRVIEGFAATDVTDLGLSLDAEKLAEFAASGLLTNDNGRIALTRSGRLMADRIAGEISP